MTSDPLEHAESLIALIPDFPEPGILFRDISPLLADATALRTVVDAIVAPFAREFDVVAGVVGERVAVACVRGIFVGPVQVARRR